MTIVKHVVLFKFKPETTQATLSEISKQLKALVSIPGVVGIDYGQTFTNERSQVR